MNHMTQEQLFAFVDGRLEDDRVTAHLDECRRCRKEVAFQRSLVGTARGLPLTKPSARLTERVMSRVLRTTQERSFSYRILQNLGYVFAMMMVLAVLGYILNNSASFLVAEHEAQPSELVTAWKSYYSQMNQLLTKSSAQFSQAVTQRTATSAWKIVLTTFCILVGYGALDRFVLQKVIRMKM
ncbi:MAG: anti-sigma factor family protein [Bacteroidota bacterium]